MASYRYPQQTLYNRVEKYWVQEPAAERGSRYVCSVFSRRTSTTLSPRSHSHHHSRDALEEAEAEYNKKLEAEVLPEVPKPIGVTVVNTVKVDVRANPLPPDFFERRAHPPVTPRSRDISMMTSPIGSLSSDFQDSLADV